MYKFDLEKAISAWRRSLRMNRAFLRDDLEELESHLRDHVERLESGGMDCRTAFRTALTRLGNYGELELEYDKVRFGTSKRRQSVLRESIWTLAMLRNYLTIATRNLHRHKFYASLNIGGLATGLAACLLILVYVTDELRFDQFHARANEIYRLNWDYSWNDSESMSSGTPPPLAAALVDEIPGIRETTRIFSAPDMVVRYQDRAFSETGILGVDSTFFDLFSFRLLEGNPETALAAPGSAILTEQTARKYFGESPALGQSIRIGKDQAGFAGPYSSDFRITGIVQDPPEHSHIQFDLLVSMGSYSQVTYFDWSWIWMQMATYAVVEDAASIPVLEAQVVALVAERAPPAFTRVGFSFPELLEAGGYWNFVFQPLTDIHLGSEQIGNRLGPTGSRTNLVIFIVVALFILGIACINSMNLSTARSASRANEVGVRKVLGSGRRSLMGQFILESVLFSSLAVVLAIGLAWALLAPFNQIAQKSLDLSVFQTAWLPLGLVLVIAAIGLLIGSYPSFYLSAFKPIHVLKGGITTGRKGQRFRNGLVVLQFSISIALIICTLLVRNQMLFFGQADMGFDKSGLLVISNENDRLGNRVDSFKESLQAQASVANVSLTTGVPSADVFQDYYKIEGLGDEQWELASYLVDDDFVSTLGMEMVVGQDFLVDSPANSRRVILNEEAVRQFGWDGAVGKTIFYPSVGEFEVIGVLKDFNFLSLQAPISPFALFHQSSKSYTIPNASIAVRLGQGDPRVTLAAIEREWNRVAPDAPFEYTFLDETVANQYSTQAALQNLFMVFAALAVVIACLGLWGLAAFAAEKRTKEIGIRKSLGATVPSLLLLLVRDFTKWVLVANIIAWPIAWLWVDHWLGAFAFRVGIGFGPFLGAGLAALAIAVLTVGHQASKTAKADPVRALRY